MLGYRSITTCSSVVVWLVSRKRTSPPADWYGPVPPVMAMVPALSGGSSMPWAVIWPFPDSAVPLVKPGLFVPKPNQRAITVG
jgi:hypothetical protein